MFSFKGKTVYIISLETWGSMRVSKHHYAQMLAERGCRVFFMEPPNLAEQGIRILPTTDHPNLSIVKYKPVIRGKRFLPTWLYSRLMRIEANRLMKAIGHPPDLIWCFIGFQFINLRHFRAPFTIFFSADLFGQEKLPPELSSADLILSVAVTQLERIRRQGYVARHVNHGLSRVFCQAAEEKLLNPAPKRLPERPVVGYSGNLRIESLDRESVLEVVRAHPDFTFVFWGSYRPFELNVYGLMDEGTETFLKDLGSQPNVVLRGAIPHDQLVKEMHEVDILWFCWRFRYVLQRDNSNAHKILEYLSTGLPIIAHSVIQYEGMDLMYMLSMEEADNYPAFFSETVRQIAEGEDPGLVSRRIRFALDNSYEKQLDRIESMINETHS